MGGASRKLSSGKWIKGSSFVIEKYSKDTHTTVKLSNHKINSTIHDYDSTTE